MPPQPLENANMAEKIARLRSELEVCNSQQPEFKRSAPGHQKISQLVSELVEIYRTSRDIDKELELYESQQKYYSDYKDDRGVIPWEIYKGACCQEYGKREEAIQHLEKGFQLWEAAWKRTEWVSCLEMPRGVAWRLKEDTLILTRIDLWFENGAIQ
jgi:tetratricopeptide (TPR) repeat protein